MNRQTIDHKLMEYVLTLLSFSDNTNRDTFEPTAEAEFDKENNLLNSQNIQAAKELIHFMDEMPGGFFIYHADETAKIIYANKALLRIFQCDTINEFQELTGNSFKGLVYSEDLENVETSIKKQIAESKYDLDYVEYRIVRKDGTIGWVEDYGHFIHNQTLGDIFYVFVGDATEKKNLLLKAKNNFIHETTQKEKDLQSLLAEYDKERKLITQEYLRRLEVIEGLSVNYESILYADLNSDKIFPYRLSSRTEYQFKKKYQVRGFTWYAQDYVNTWVHPEDQELVFNATDPDYIRERLADSKTYYINYRIINEGQLQYLQLRIVNVGNKNKISQIVMGYRRVDEEIRRELEQKQLLEEALDSARLASIAKNTFLSNMSHDMRTPLNAIFGFTSLAKQNITDSETVLYYLDKLEIAGKQLLELIDKTLELSWMETNDIHLSIHECNLCDILQEVYNSLLPQAQEKHITFSLNSAHLEHCDIYSDKDKLKQLFLYLGNNAVTYTNSGGEVDMIVSESERLPNEYAVYQFIVKDTGIGISNDFLSRIFEPFEREKNTTISGIHGTGLGLTIVKNIVDMMGGNIEVTSELGVGSTFTVTLRFRIQNHPLPFSSDTEEIITNLMHKKILLVEDNEINLEIETEILRGLGFQIDTATDGSIAVEKLSNSNPGDYALILTDIQMPVMNGRQAARAIRKLENQELAHIPIIALSADAFESDKQKSKESGIDAHLTKPIDIPILLETIAQITKHHNTRYHTPPEQTN